MESFYDEYLSADFFHSLQNLVVALIVLLIGWLIAKGIGNGVEKALKKTNLNEKLFSKFRSEESNSVQSEKIVGKTIYYVLLVIVFIIFFNLLNLDMIASPLSGLMTTFFEFIPAVLKAALILLLAWVIASVLKWLVTEGSKKINLEKLFSKMKLADSEESVNKVTESAGQIVFYLVLLLFIPAVLESLSLAGLAQPFSTLLSTVLSFVPKLLAAAIIFAVGWLIAKIVKNILANLLQAAGSETWMKRLKMDNIFPGNSFAVFVGNLAFVVIIIPVVVSALEQLELEGIAEPAIGMLDKIMAILPNIIIAIALVLVGVWLGKLVGGVVQTTLERVGFNKLTQKMNVKAMKENDKLAPAAITGYIAQILVVFFLTVQALYIIKLDFLVGIASAVTAYLPLVLAAVLILGIALIVANIVEKLIKSFLAGPAVNVLAGFAKIGIVALAVFMALSQLGIATSIVNSAFIITLSGLALAFALAFGLGGREFADKNLRKLDGTIEQTSVKETEEQNPNQSNEE